MHNAAHYEAQREAVLASGAADAESRLEAIAREEAADQLQHSYAGRLGRLIEPVIRPLGYDWRIGIGLVASFAAREAFVSTMGVVYGVGEADEATPSLHKRLREAQWPDGRPLFTPLVAVGLMVFYAGLPVREHHRVVRRRRIVALPAFQLAYMTAGVHGGPWSIRWVRQHRFMKFETAA